MNSLLIILAHIVIIFIIDQSKESLKTSFFTRG